MTEYQERIFAQIRDIQKDKNPDKALLKKLAKRLTAEDNLYCCLKYGNRNDPGGRSRSPSMGKWDDYSNSY